MSFPASTVTGEADTRAPFLVSSFSQSAKNSNPSLPVSQGSSQAPKPGVPVQSANVGGTPPVDG